MAEINNTYQTDVGRERGGSLFFMKAAGNFKFFDTDYNGSYLRNFLLSRKSVWFADISAGAADDTMMSTHSRFLVPYGHILFSTMSTGDSKLSMYLPLPSVGQYLKINFGVAVGAANLSIYASANGGGLGGVSLIDIDGTVCSQLMVTAGATGGTVLLLCEVATQWSVIERDLMIVAQAN